MDFLGPYEQNFRTYCTTCGIIRKKREVRRDKTSKYHF